MISTASLKITAVIALSGLIMVGCNGTNAQLGSTTGAVLGGVIGKQLGKGRGNTAATIAGTIIGSQIGGMIGAQMDTQDHQYVDSAVYTGQQQTWQNPTTGHSYQATPGRIQNANYQGRQTQCRPVTVVANVNGQPQNMQMNACKGANGQWQATQ